MYSKFLNRMGLARLYQAKIVANDTVAVFDTSIGSFNVGDEIINDSARRILIELFPSMQHLRLSTHDGVSAVGINRANVAKCRFVCGSNLLNSNMLVNQQWNFGPLDFLRLKEMILFGVGWANYQKDASWYTRAVLKLALDSRVMHSVRDNYTKAKLESIGIRNVLNTGCPTTWVLDEDLCRRIPAVQGSNVIFTLTDYRKDQKYDGAMVELLKKKYNRVLFWVQGNKDMSYFKSLGGSVCEGVEVVPPRLEAYDSILENVDDLDFVGTRLHAGIRAMQKGVRSIIVGVDNRALEKKRDFNLPVCSRSSGVHALSDMVSGFGATNIKLNIQEIDEWKSQFKEMVL